MKTFGTSRYEELSTVKLRISKTSGRLSNWKHEEFDKLPALTYEHKEDDKKFLGKDDEILKFINEFLDIETKDGKTYKEKYEYDLKQGIRELLSNLEDGLNKSFKKEVEKRFK